MNKLLWISLIRRALMVLPIFVGFLFGAETPVLTILTFNDVYEIVPDALGRGGFAEMQTLLNQERAKSKHHITTVNGDFLSPCILSTFDKGAHRIDLFNQMGVDLVVLGNHEFDFGPEVVTKRVRESNFPWLAANAIGLDGKPFTGDQQTFILDVDGIKVGFFGLVTVETPNLSATGKQVCFSPLVYTAKEMIADLKEQGADVIVALTHLHTKEDRWLAEELPEISVILGGHDHDPETYYNDKTFIHKSGQNAYYLARIDLILEKNEETNQVTVLPSWNVILNKNFPRDPKVAGVVDELQATLEKITGEPIGVMGMDCDTLYSNVRTRESKFANLVVDALKESCEADIGFISGGLIRGNKFYRPGMVLTLRSFLTELPFQNIAVMVEIAGSAILEALENGVSKAEKKAGRFPQVSGMQFCYDINEPPGKRVQEVFIGKDPLDLKKLYKVATVDYVLNGGDGYEMFKSGKILLSPLKEVALVDMVVTHVQKMTSVVSYLGDRILVRESSQSLDDVMDLAR
ncbi:MAG: 5'-nucleotidase C-terminal domain-containing protein [Chlamydiota bacterium]